MKAVVVREKMKAAVSIAERMTGRNLSLPVLGSVLFSFEKDTIRIRATNLELGIEVVIPARVESEGVIAVPGSILYTILSSVSDESISLKENNGNLEILTRNATSRINGVSHEDFPNLPVVEPESRFVVSASKFVAGLKSVWYSASISDIKPEIASVYVYQEGDELIFVATDSFRLAEKRITNKPNTDIGAFLIPVRNVSEVIRVLEGREGDVEVSFNANQVAFTLDGMYITSRLIDGVFPDYKQIIPKENTTEAVVLKQDFLNALKMTNIFADKFNQVSLSINAEKHQCSIRANNAELGENTTALDATVSGNAASLNFNYKYILDCLQAIPSDSITLSMNGEGKPLVIRGVGDPSFLYLVMPLNN